MIYALIALSYVVGFIYARKRLIEDFGDEVPIILIVMLFLSAPIMGLTGLVTKYFHATHKL